VEEEYFLLNPQRIQKLIVAQPIKTSTSPSSSAVGIKKGKSEEIIRNESPVAASHKFGPNETSVP
jgi:hypothetical protein